MKLFLKEVTEVVEYTDSERWFQREGPQEQNASASALFLILGQDKVIPLFDPSEWDRSDVARMEWTEAGRFSWRVL